MPDTVAATIKIGGDLPADKVKKFCEIIGQEDVKSRYDLEKMVDKDGVLVVEDDSCPWGRFESLEEFCLENSLSYIRSNGGSYTIDSSVEFWTPDTPGILCFYTNNETGEILYQPAHLQDLKDMLSDESHIDRAEAAIAEIDRLLNPFPELPRFRITKKKK